jgi:type I restriction enzyme S subunit
VPQLSEFTFPLPPLAEQKQIAAKLDELLAQVDTIKARLDAIPKILKRFRQSVLAAAGSGRLTEEWRESKGECSWSSATLIEICNPKRALTYGVIKLGDETSDGVICLRTSNVRWLQVDVDSVKKIAPEISNEYTRTILDGTEVLVNVRGTLGGVAAATPEMKGWNVSREVAVVPISSGIANSEFIAFLIASEEKQKWLTGVQKGVAYTGINIEDLRELPINLPSRAEQTEIVRRVEQLFAFADQIETRVQDATARVNHLTQSILAKAFRGELTADWRAQNPDLISGENSAEALLARIRAEREAASKPKKAKVIRHSRAGGNP